MLPAPFHKFYCGKIMSNNANVILVIAEDFYVLYHSSALWPSQTASLESSAPAVRWSSEEQNGNDQSHHVQVDMQCVYSKYTLFYIFYRLRGRFCVL